MAEETVEQKIVRRDALQAAYDKLIAGELVVEDRYGEFGQKFATADADRMLARINQLNREISDMSGCGRRGRGFTPLFR